MVSALVSSVDRRRKVQVSCPGANTAETHYCDETDRIKPFTEYLGLFGYKKVIFCILGPIFAVNWLRTCINEGICARYTCLS